MLRKNISSSHRFTRLVLLLPLLFGMIFCVSCRQEEKFSISAQLNQNDVNLKFRESPITHEDSKEMIDLVSKNTVTQLEKLQDSVLTVPFAVIDEVPVFPGCEDFTITEQRDCFKTKMNEHIITHFRYPREAMMKEITGRVFVMFIINEYGEVENIQLKGPHPLLEAEADRIISLLPTHFTPGKHKGKPAKMPYTVPITFFMKTMK